MMLLPRLLLSLCAALIVIQVEFVTSQTTNFLDVTYFDAQPGVTYDLTVYQYDTGTATFNQFTTSTLDGNAGSQRVSVDPAHVYYTEIFNNGALVSTEVQDLTSSKPPAYHNGAGPFVDGPTQVGVGDYSVSVDLQADTLEAQLQAQNFDQRQVRLRGRDNLYGLIDIVRTVPINTASLTFGNLGGGNYVVTTTLQNSGTGAQALGSPVSTNIAVPEDRPGRTVPTEPTVVTGLPINGGWSGWSAPTTCSATCGVGVRRQTRTCTNPRPQFGGQACRGPANRMAACNGPSCQAASCPALQPPVNGYMNPSPTDDERSLFNVTKTFGCENGYNLASHLSVSRTCQATGQWSGVLARCDPKSCPAIESPPNGTIATKVENGLAMEVNPNSESGVFGTVLTFACGSGYKYLNSEHRSLRCGANGTWEGTLSTCILQKCPLLTAPENGQLTANRRHVGDMATYECNVGYELQGGPVRVCQDSGTWNGTDPQCRLPCPPAHCADAMWRLANKCSLDSITKQDACRPSAKRNTDIALLGRVKRGSIPRCLEGDVPAYTITLRVRKELFRSEQCDFLPLMSAGRYDVTLLQLRVNNGCPCPHSEQGETYMVTANCDGQNRQLVLHQESLFKRHTKKAEQRLTARCGY